MSLVLVTRDKETPAVAVLTLNRPEAMNSYNMALHDAMVEAIKQADADPSIRVIVITGAINGAAVGIGATMLCPMDMRVASKKAKFAFPFARRGIVCDGAASWFLPRLVGFAKANEWILRANILTADELHAAGFLSDICEPEEVLPRSLDIARDIAINCSPTSTANNKRLLRASLLGGGALEDGPFKMHMMESKMLNKAFVGPDCAEGVQSFLEKRPPEFKDRQD